MSNPWYSQQTPHTIYEHDRKTLPVSALAYSTDNLSYHVARGCPHCRCWTSHPTSKCVLEPIGQKHCHHFSCIEICSPGSQIISCCRRQNICSMHCYKDKRKPYSKIAIVIQISITLMTQYESLIRPALHTTNRTHLCDILSLFSSAENTPPTRLG